MSIGLILIIIVATAIINEMVIKSMRSVKRIENSNKAYLAAEAGLEDALYELSEHFAGYETKNRVDNLNQSEKIQWESDWSIISRSHQNEWPTEEKFYKHQKFFGFSLL